jgi:hypothetical protein
MRDRLQAALHALMYCGITSHRSSPVLDGHIEEEFVMRAHCIRHHQIMTAFNRLQIPLCAKMCRQKDVSAMKGHHVYPVGKQHEQMETMKPVFEFLGATLSNPDVGKSVILSGAHGQTQVRSSQLMHNT